MRCSTVIRREFNVHGLQAVNGMFHFWIIRILLCVSDAKLSGMVSIVLGIILRRDSFDSWLLDKVVPAFVQKVRIHDKDVNQSERAPCFSAK